MNARPAQADGECAICGHSADHGAFCGTCRYYIATATPQWLSFFVRHRNGEPRIFDTKTGVLHVLEGGNV
jgi:hypothetical protein